MNTRMVGLIIAVVAISLVAVGIGYAYTASMTNSGNSAGATYLTLSPEEANATTTTAGWTANLADYKLYYDTVAIDATTTQYTINTTDAGAAPAKLVGNDDTIVSTNGTKTLYLLGIQKITLTSSDKSAPDITVKIASAAGTGGGSYNSNFTIYLTASTAESLVGAKVVSNTFNTQSTIGTLNPTWNTTTGATDVYVAVLAELPSSNTTAPGNAIFTNINFTYSFEVTPTTS